MKKNKKKHKYNKEINRRSEKDGEEQIERWCKRETEEYRSHRELINENTGEATQTKTE